MKMYHGRIGDERLMIIKGQKTFDEGVRFEESLEG